MIRVGNDIVDLTDPKNMGKSQDARFIDRVFTPREQELIFRAENRDAVLWALWTGKEAAYKLVRKHDPSVTSVPRAYNVSLDCPRKFLESRINSDTLRGCVETPYGTMEISVFMTSDYVHCIGSTPPDDVDSLIWHVDRITLNSETFPACESAFVRKALKLHLSTYCHESPESIEIRRVNDHHGLGPPLVSINGKAAEIDISLSHDGKFAAYAFTTPRSGYVMAECRG